MTEAQELAEQLEAHIASRPKTIPMGNPEYAVPGTGSWAAHAEILLELAAKALRSLAGPV